MRKNRQQTESTKNPSKPFMGDWKGLLKALSLLVQPESVSKPHLPLPPFCPSYQTCPGYPALIVKYSSVGAWLLVLHCATFTQRSLWVSTLAIGFCGACVLPYSRVLSTASIIALFACPSFLLKTFILHRCLLSRWVGWALCSTPICRKSCFLLGV